MGDASDILQPSEIEAIDERAKLWKARGIEQTGSVADDRAALLRHLDALTAPADGEALGRKLLRWIAEQMPSAACPPMASIVDEALHLHAIGHAAGALSREGEIAALSARLGRLHDEYEANERDRQTRIATIARLTVELESLHADTAQHADEVATLTRTIVSLTAELARETHKKEDAQDQVTALRGKINEEALAAAMTAARADGARVERGRLTGELSIEFERLSRAEHDRGERFLPGDAEGDAHDAARDAYSEAAKIVRARGCR